MSFLKLPLDKCPYKMYYDKCTDKKERGDLMSPKGRPTDNPKKGRFEIRTSQEEEEMLDYCCEITGKKRTDIIRLGIRKVYEELKK